MSWVEMGFKVCLRTTGFWILLGLPEMALYSSLLVFQNSGKSRCSLWDLGEADPFPSSRSQEMVSDPQRGRAILGISKVDQGLLVYESCFSVKGSVSKGQTLQGRERVADLRGVPWRVASKAESWGPKPEN